MRVRYVFSAIVLLAALLVLPAGTVQASCSGDECWNCLGTDCMSAPTAGHCSCESGGNMTSKWCIAGGGSCTIIY